MRSVTSRKLSDGIYLCQHVAIIRKVRKGSRSDADDERDIERKMDGDLAD